MTSSPNKMGVWGQNRRRGGSIVTPKNSFLFWLVLTSVPILVNIDQEMRPTHRPTRTLTVWRIDRQTQTDFITLYARAMGQIISTCS